MQSITTPICEEFQRLQDFWNSNIKDGCIFSISIDGKQHPITMQNYVGMSVAEDNGNTVCTRMFRVGVLLIRQEAILYNDLPMCEWTLYVKNDSDKVSPKVSFKAMDVKLDSERFITTLYRHIGSEARKDDHMPFVDALDFRKKISVSPYGGRSSNHEWPYFSLRLADYGVNIAIGWLGNWLFEAYNDNTVRAHKNASTAADVVSKNYTQLTVSQQRLNSVILPGEEFRSPRVVLQFWELAGLSENKAVRRSQNIFRKYMRKYNMPRYADGTIPTHGLAACSSHQCFEMQRANTENQKAFIDAYSKRGVELDYWWMDAGWYVDGDKDWQNVGTWKVDKKRFPNGLKEIADHAKAKGFGTVLWHEPERAKKGSELYEEHPEFLLSPVYADGTANTDTDFSLLNFGDDTAREWITNRISGNITDSGVTVYRQDFNTDPLDYIDPNESEDRKGAIENHYCCGMLRYWDDLVLQHPGLMIDECASGGRRDDIDAMKRALMFIRSDYLFETISQQCHTGWIADWMPFFGTGILIGKSLIDTKSIPISYDYYALMSMTAPHMTCCIDPRDDYYEWDKIAQFFKDWREYAPCFSGDYYPLTEITLDDSNWAAWQFNRFDEGDGIVQAFRRPECVEGERVFALSDLEPDAVYHFHRYEKEEDFEMTGAQAMKGFKISLEPREAVIFRYIRK